jgi:hypothetical protein
MRFYQLTSRGRKVCKVPCQVRNDIMDHLYPNKKVPKEELAAVVGPNNVERELRTLLHKRYVEEVREDGFMS